MRMPRHPSRVAALRLLAAIAIGGGAYGMYLMACQASSVVTPAKPGVSPANPPAGMYQKLYSQTFTVANSNDTYTWSVSDPGDLPPGVTMSTAGVLSGTPSLARTYNFTVVATSTTGGTNYSGMLCLNIFFLVTPAELPAGTVGVLFSQQLGGTGGTAPYGSWSLLSPSAFPVTGLSVNSAGLISGTPGAGAAGTYIFTVQSFDAKGAIGRKTDTLTILAAGSPLTITTTSPLTGGTVGTGYSTSFAAAGGTSPYTWSITSLPATVPPGLSMSPAGVLSGTPTGTGGSYTFTVQVTDAASHVTSLPFSLTVVAPLTITTTSPLPGGTVGVVYNTSGEQFAATGGTGAYTWAITSAAATVPPGLALSAAGLLAGTPTGSGGSYTFTVQVTDAASRVKSGPFTVTIALAPVTITTTSPLPAGTVGSAYTTPLTATGGTGTYVWSITAGATPTGLTLNADGTWSGTPTAANTFTFTAKATSGTATPASRAFSLTINSAGSLVITSTSPIPQAFLNNAYYYQFTASGGTPPYTWSKTSPGVVIPPGLTLAPGGFLQGSPTATGATAMALTVTDHANNTASGSFMITVNPAPTSCLILANGTNQPVTAGVQTLPSVSTSGFYDVTLTVPGCLSSDPTTYYGWTVSTGTLPNGFVIQSGPPTSIYAPAIIVPVGTYTFSITFTGFDPVDNSGHNFTQAYSLTITP